LETRRKRLLDSRNPRAHSPIQVRQIAHSIEAFGFNVPVLIDAKRKVIAGSGSLRKDAMTCLSYAQVSRGFEHASIRAPFVD
jgi:hypothetical protein